MLHFTLERLQSPLENDLLKDTVAWIRADWRSHPVRFCIETWAWAFSIIAAALFAATVPNVPLVLYLSITVTNCALYTWAAWHRGSFGLFANYLVLTLLDAVAITRTLLAS